MDGKGNMEIIKEVEIKVKKCVDYGCVWHLDKYGNGCGKFIDLQTCVERNGRMTAEEAKKLGNIV